MNNAMMVKVNGMSIPVSRMRHWAYAPEQFVPNRSEGEMRQWSIFMGVKDAWDRLDPEIFESVLSPDFTYGSYWVSNQQLNREGYKDYIGKKFDTIRRSDAKPRMDMVVLYEGLSPQSFCYALRMRQGNVETLLTFGFDDCGLSSLYMTDPQIFTFEPTFPKGGIVGKDGEPRAFMHKCDAGNKGKTMTVVQLQAFAVECVTTLLRESGSDIAGSYKSPYKEFPNIVTRSGSDLFYHRIDVSMPADDGKIVGDEMEDFLSAARQHDAWPMVMPVSLYCVESNGAAMLTGGTFFMKCLESRRVGQ